MKTIKLTLSGMHCASCGTNVERALRKVPGVESVAVSVLLKKATVQLSKDVPSEQLRKAVASAGYTVVSEA